MAAEGAGETRVAKKERPAPVPSAPASSSSSSESTDSEDYESANSGEVTEVTTQVPHVSTIHSGEGAIDRRVEIFWPEENADFVGTVTGYDEKSKKHTVTYDDGDVECELELHKEQMEWLTPASASASVLDKPGTAAAPAPRGYGYDPIVDEYKKIPWLAHLDACWAVVFAAWDALLDEHGIARDAPCRQHYYRPMRCHGEPPEWRHGTEGRGFDRATTVACTRHFAGEFLTQNLSLDLFGGYGDVL